MHYSSDQGTLSIDKQFFYGPSLLISPVTDAESTSVTFYLPNDIFYDFHTLKKIQGSGATITLSNVSFTDIPVHIRGGSIIPARVKSALTTAEVREQNFELLVALDKDGKAKGSLYLDDGESLVQQGTSEIEFTFEGSTIKMGGSFGFPTKLSVASVTIMGDNTMKYELGEGLDGTWERDLSQQDGVAL